MAMTFLSLAVDDTNLITPQVDNEIKEYKKRYNACIAKITALQQEISLYEQQLFEYSKTLNQLNQIKENN